MPAKFERGHHEIFQKRHDDRTKSGVRFPDVPVSQGKIALDGYHLKLTAKRLSGAFACPDRNVLPVHFHCVAQP